MDLFNKYANLNDDQVSRHIEDLEIKHAIEISKKKFNKKNKIKKDLYDNQVLVAKLNSELDDKKEYERHIEAALMDSKKMHAVEENIAASKQMEEDRKLGFFGDYPEINSALNRNNDYLLRINNLRKNEVIPDDFVRISSTNK